MKKKEIVTLALTAALLMTAHAVPVAAAESAAPNATSPTMPAQAITLRWERFILKRKAETVGHPLLLGRLMELELSVLPKPTPARRALPTVPE